VSSTPATLEVSKDKQHNKATVAVTDEDISLFVAFIHVDVHVLLVLISTADERTSLFTEDTILSILTANSEPFTSPNLSTKHAQSGPYELMELKEICKSDRKHFSD
jgi:hypothetical protein